MKQTLLLLLLVVLITSFTKRNIKWVAIGDSITYLNDHPDETGNRVTKGYMTMVAEKLPNITYVNQGHNGWTSGGIADAIDKLGIVEADVYSVFLGTNDWWQGRPLGTLQDFVNNTGNATVYGSFRIIINKLRSLNSNAKIILITPMQRSDFVYINDDKNNAYGSYRAKNGQYLEQFAKAIDSIGKNEKFEVIDLYHQRGMAIKDLVKFKRLKDPQTAAYKDFVYPDYIDVPFHPGEDAYPYPPEAIDVTYDGLHPSDKGNEMISKLLIQKLKR